MSRALRWYVECETWNTHDTGTSHRLYRRWWNTRELAEEDFPRVRIQLQHDFGKRFVDARVVQR